MDNMENLIREVVRDEMKNYIAEHPELPVIHRYPDPLAQFKGLDPKSLKEITKMMLEREVARLYSVRAVAELLEASVGYVYDRIKKGELAVVELGDERAKQRIAAPELQRFIESRTYGRH